MVINICISPDDNYSKYAAATIASVLINAYDKDELFFYILDGDLSNDNKIKLKSLEAIKPCHIEFVKVNKEDFKIYKDIQTHSYVSISTYYRLKLAKMLPQISKIIYLDCDTIVCSSLSELFNTNIETKSAGGVLDVRVKHKKQWENTKYVNAGVLLFNLNNIRKNNIEDKYEQYAIKHTEQIKTGDQDIINFVLGNNIAILDDEWNVQVSGFMSRSSFTRKPKIIHYIGNQKPWIFGAVTFFKEKYFEALEYTPWAIDEREKFKWVTINKIITFLKFFKNRPFNLLRPKFWYTAYLTYLKKPSNNKRIEYNFEKLKIKNESL